MSAQTPPNEFKFKNKPVRVAMMAALASAYPLTGYAAGAARIDFVTADVTAVAPDGRSRPLAKGAEVASGETIDTGNGRAQLRFSDGAQMALAPQTQFRIDEYRFNGRADGSERGFFSLVKGAMRTITGLVGRSNHDHYKVTTSVATIGIRGTEYSVAYQNGSIDTTTGEGSTLVCNAAGCLILDSGETAFVPDQNTKPVMTDQRTEIPPPSVQEGALPGFVAGDSTKSDGSPLALPSAGAPANKLVSGSGYSLAISGVGSMMGSMSDMMSDDYATQAVFGDGGLTGFAATEYEGSPPRFVSFTPGTSLPMQTDGVLGWGRWIDGAHHLETEVTLDEAIQNVHYVVGVPTSLADMNALQSANVTASYSLSGFTYPTSWDGSTFTVGTQPVTGSLTANFGAATVSGDLAVPIGGNTYSVDWTNVSILGSSFRDSSVSGPVNVSSPACCACSAVIQGFFAGANAARAGLVYEITDITQSIHGAAAFKKAGGGGGGG